MKLNSVKNKHLSFFIVTFSFYFLLILVSPLSVNIDTSPTAILIFLTSLLVIPPSIILGIKFVKMLPKKITKKQSFSFASYENKISFTVYRLNFWAAVGLVLMIIDRFYLRGLSIGFELFVARDLLESTETTPFGLVGQILSSLIIFSYGFFLIEKKFNNFSKIKSLITHLLLLLYLFLSLMLGSRSGILNCLLIVVFMTLLDNYMRDPNYKISFTFLMKIFFLGIVFILSMAAVFLWRLDESGVDVAYSILNSGYAYTLTPYESIINYSKEGVLGDLFLATISIFQYALHGFYEFQLLVENYNGDHTYGQQVFWFPIKVINTLGGSFNVTDLENIHGVRNGIFTSFFGPIFIDFGYFTPLATAIIFYFISIPIGLMSLNRAWSISYSAVVACLIVCLPFWNSILSAMWMYPFISILMIPLLTLKFRINFSK